jgi:predicted amidohydrolase
MNPQRQYRAAAIQFEPEHGEKDRNGARLEQLVRQAAAQGARLIVMPEMATIGLFWRDREHIAPYVETIPGDTTDFFTRLARELDVYLVVGMGEADPDTRLYYNSAALVGPDGVLGVHRKVHAYLSDPLWAADGDLGFQTWATPLGRLGILICMDANYPESGGLLAGSGADVLLMPVGWVEEVCPAPLWMMRAFDNGLPAVCANRWGSEGNGNFSGGSAVLNPNGTIQACAGKQNHDEIVMGTIDLDDPRRRRLGVNEAAVQQRRPELYAPLLLNRYLWDARQMQAQFAHPLPEGLPFQAITVEYERPLPVLERLAALDALLPTDAPALFVLPELSFCGSPQTEEQARENAESLEGSSVAALTRWCEQRGCYLVAGLIESDRQSLYNTLVLVGPQGVCAHYRKTHLSERDRIWATAGDRLVWADVPIGRIGLLTGTDLLFAEPARCLAILGCDMVCVSAALTEPRPVYRQSFTGTASDEIHWHLARTRAGENDVYLAFANWRQPQQTGHSGVFFGPSLLAAPQHEAQVPANASECASAAALITAQMQPQSALRTKPGLQRRLSAQYSRLLQRQEIRE